MFVPCYRDKGLPLFAPFPFERVAMNSCTSREVIALKESLVKWGKVNLENAYHTTPYCDIIFSGSDLLAFIAVSTNSIYHK
ncbi:hypothetical protein YM18_2088 [Geobacter sulfurreducens]|nr:hypothetical protein YM18_2088 [Geobacter sulfurreducens]